VLLITVRKLVSFLEIPPAANHQKKPDALFPKKVLLMILAELPR